MGYRYTHVLAVGINTGIDEKYLNLKGVILLNTYAIELWGHTSTEVGETSGKAKYRFFLQHEIGDSIRFGDFVKQVKCRLIHKFRVSDLFTKDRDSFIHMRRNRGIDFAEVGMRVEVDGKSGVIVGSNSSMNLDVCFDGQSWKENCHPWWRVKYFTHDGHLIKEFLD